MWSPVKSYRELPAFKKGIAVCIAALAALGLLVGAIANAMTRTSSLTRNVLKMTASAFIISATLVSCTNSETRPATYSAKAEKAADKGNFAVALVNAEAAVAGAPRNAHYRSTLAQTYLASGRFLSAERSFEDAIELGDISARNVISMALSQIAQGKNGEALSTVSEYRYLIPNGDYGLALALAGQTRQGVNVLESEVREGVNSPKTRQNLALAYALDGSWREARTMAMQDVSPDKVDQRLIEWVQMSRPEHYQVRVASLLGVTPQADAGQPVRLALANYPAMAEMVAEIAEPERAEIAEAEPVQPVVQARPAQLAMASAAEDDTSVMAPLIAAMSGPVKKVPVPETLDATNAAAPSSQRAPIVEIAKAVSPVRQASKPGRLAKGSYIVQLGAFSSAGNAERAWSLLSKKYNDLDAFGYASSIIDSNGRKLHRLAATGFGNAAGAVAMCQGIKAQGGNCIVRQVGNSKPVKASAVLAARR